jgi:hypothetical protein
VGVAAGQQVLHHGAVLEQRQVLEGAADADGGEVGRAHGRRVLPSKLTLAAAGSSTPLIMLKVVVLPAPLGPIRLTISPGITVQADIGDGLDAAEALDRFRPLGQCGASRERAVS